jgi:hypothetical protein
MTSPGVTGRRPAGGRPTRGARRPSIRAPPPIRRRGKTPIEFCQTWGISLSTFEVWQRKGIGPRVTQPAGRGGHRLITEEEEDRWSQQALAAE